MKQQKIFLFTVSLFLLAFFTFCQGGRSFRKNHDTSGNLKEKSIVVDGKKRTYHIVLPENKQNMSMLIALHGGQGNGPKLEEQTHLGKDTVKKNILLVYPSSMNEKPWNDGRSTSKNSVDDVRFITAIVEQLKKEYSILSSKVGVVGISSGGMMTLRLACDASSTFNSFGVFSASMPEDYFNHCRPNAEIHIYFVHSPVDPLMPYNGGRIKSSKAMGSGGKVISLQKTLEFWLNKNQCTMDPKAERIIDGKDRRTRVRYNAAKCKKGSVQNYVVEGGGHIWPGSKRPGLLRRRVIGEPSGEISGNEIVIENLLN